MVQMVELTQMLDARESRAAKQKSLREAYGATMLCITMNIAGPVKNSPLIRRGFEIGNTLLQQQLAAAKLTCLHFEEENNSTGSEAYYIVEAEALAVKRIAVELEDQTPLGRLFDMDVLDAAGDKLDRALLGLPDRTCLCCGGMAKACARSRAHTVAELQKKTKELLQSAVTQWDAQKIAEQACRALLFEVCTTPKPGLVDRMNSGSHSDMDLFTFMSSATALWPYFEECALQGSRTAERPAQETFAAIRPAGRRAEGSMLAATAGVNTHKGAIFSVGILCAALGRLTPKQRRCPNTVLSEAAAMTAGLTAHDYQKVTLQNASTTGERLFAQHGITGVRGQVEAGFPAVHKVGLPVLEQGLADGKDLNEAGCAALLALIAAEIDTNIIARSDLETQQQVARQAGALLQQQPYPGKAVLEALDAEYTAKNLSPGGSADLLAVCYLLHFMKEGA